MIEGRPDCRAAGNAAGNSDGLVHHRAETAEGARIGVEIRIEQLGGDDAAGKFALLMHADGAVHAIVADHDDDRQPILNGDARIPGRSSGNRRRH